MNCRTNAAARPNTQLDSIFLHYERALCITGAFSIRVGVSTKVTQNCNDTKEDLLSCRATQTHKSICFPLVHLHRDTTTAVRLYSSECIDRISS
ncbi:uncharacterized protein LOC143742373 isoform X3 [Siphateles boraxobius]|uniref:uncharacterized protein LOC143742373 isoform X3 n=1 Tax=Siphateles boraxobius TaxID=180520 RepID=UPI00406435AD